jgi:hypothetical protein
MHESSIWNRHKDKAIITVYCCKQEPESARKVLQAYQFLMEYNILFRGSFSISPGLSGGWPKW